MKSTVRFEQNGNVGNIVLCNPPGNELSRRFADDLLAAVHDASSSDIRALVVRSEGPNFGTGGHVPEWPGKSMSWFRTFIAEVNQAYAAIEALRLPSIAAVRGVAIGGHYELVLRCDLIVAAEGATFTWVESGSGMAPLAGGIQRLAERIGRSRALSHVLLARTLKAAEAMELGLVERVVPDGELDAAVEALAEQLGNGATRGYAATRALLKAWSSGGVAGADELLLELTMDLYASADAQRAIVGITAAAAAGEGYVPPPFTGE